MTTFETVITFLDNILVDQIDYLSHLVDKPTSQRPT